jgi:hypothetical protein
LGYAKSRPISLSYLTIQSTNWGRAEIALHRQWTLRELFGAYEVR